MGIWTLVLLIKEAKQCYWATRLLAFFLAGGIDMIGFEIYGIRSMIVALYHFAKTPMDFFFVGSNAHSVLE